MKKLLTTICALTLMTSFVSCGDTEYVKYETDYLSFEYPSNWEIKKDSPSVGSADYLSINTDDSLIFFNYFVSEAMYDKLTTNELKEKWERTAEDLKKEAEYDDDSKFLYEERYENKEITNDFVKNGQAYILITDSLDNSKYIEFQADGLSGTISLYSDNAEEEVMTILETLEFN